MNSSTKGFVVGFVVGVFAYHMIASKKIAAAKQ